MLFYFHEPLLHVGEGLLARDIVAKEDTVSATVKDSSNRAERLLASRVPNL